MDESPDQLLRIGVFSTLSQISVRMLRHYQDRGLLMPARVDPFTGFRFYAPGQLADARVITVMRDAGMGIVQMAEVLACRSDPAAVHRLVAEHRDRLEAERAALSARRHALELVESQVARHLTQEALMSSDVRTQTFPSHTVAALRGILPTYADEGDLWQQIMPLIGRSGARLPERPLCGATFHDPDYRETDVDVEIWMQVDAPFEPVAPLTCRQVPEREVVATTLHGDYSGISQAMEALGAYIAQRHLDTGPMFNIYHVGPAQDPDPAHWVTDVCLPVVVH